MTEKDESFKTTKVRIVIISSSGPPDALLSVLIFLPGDPGKNRRQSVEGQAMRWAG